jgi:peptide/nickel transport system substrate-binding protein
MFHHNAHVVGRSGIARLMLTTAIILILSTLALGATSAQDSGGTLRVGLPPVENLDPATGTNDPEILFNRSIYDFLIETTPDGTLVPNLAESWDVSGDGLTYTLNLVQGATFHDGSPFTSADVVYTFNRLVGLEAQSTNLMGEFEISAPDENTVVFTLPAVNADFLYGIATQSAVIMQDGNETPNTLGDGDDVFASFNGTGPFVLTDYTPGESAVFTKNENYWGEGPNIDTLEFIFITDTLAQVDALRSGAVDVIFKFDPDQIPVLEGEDGINIIEVATNQHPVIRIRSDAGALGENPLIREAFKVATNRQELLDTVQGGLGFLGHNDPIGPKYGVFYDDMIADPEYDPARACELVQEATGEDRISSDFYVVNDFNYEALSVALQGQWAEGCIDVNILLRDTGLYYADTEWLEVDLGITGWGDRAIPQPYLTSAYYTDGPFNETHFSDAELDSLIDQAGQITDQDARAAVYSQISQVFADRGPIIIPWFASVFSAASDRVEGLAVHPFSGLTDFRSVSVSG